MAHSFQLIHENIKKVKVVVFILSLIPALEMLYRYNTDQLGINGLEYLIRTNGYFAMFFLILTLAITPFRRLLAYLMNLWHLKFGKRLGDWNWIIKLRRMLGLFSFFYAVLHFLVFFYFELDLEWSDLLLEIEERRFILAGASALVLLIPLAITSTNGMIRRLKQNWRRLHRLMYPISILVVVHYLWLTKPGVYDAHPYVFIVAALLLFRLFAKFKVIFKRNDDGMEVERR